MRLRAPSLLVCCSLALLAACGDPEPNGPIVQPNNNTTPDMTGGDMTGGDMTGGDMGDMQPDAGDDMDGPDGDMSAPDQGDMGGGMGPFCRDAEDLGVLDVNAGIKMLAGDTTGKMSVVGTQCGFNSGAEKIFKFTLSAPARLDLALTPSSAINWVMDMRAGDCAQTTSLFCARNPNTTFVADDDKTYFLVVEPLDSAAEGAFQIRVTPTPLVCLPVGERTCVGEDLKQCIQGGAAEETLDCAAPCSMNACGGDLCENAIVVNSFPFEFTGPSAPYSSSFNFSAPNSCVFADTAYIPPDPNDPDANMMPGEPGAPISSMSTPGQDVVFRLPGLMAGQKLTVDASTNLGDSSDNAIFVMNSCDPMSCLVALDIGDVLSGWTVPANGDYIVVVDRRAASNQDIKIRLSLE
jgi:hypothetical protein